MGIFQQLFNRFSTESKQLQDSIDTAPLQHQLQALKQDLAQLKLDYLADAEKTKKKLESYRARNQPRKEGRFAPQEPAQPSNDGGLMEQPTHDEIEALAQSQGLIR